jgi:hypothetical protein
MIKPTSRNRTPWSTGRKSPTIPSRMKIQPAIRVRILLVREVTAIGSDLKVTGSTARRKIQSYPERL